MLQKSSEWAVPIIEFIQNMMTFAAMTISTQ